MSKRLILALWVFAALPGQAQSNRSLPRLSASKVHKRAIAEAATEKALAAPVDQEVAPTPQKVAPDKSAGGYVVPAPPPSEADQEAQEDSGETGTDGTGTTSVVELRLSDLPLVREHREPDGRVVQVRRTSSGELIEIVRDASGSLVSARDLESDEWR